MSRSDSSMAPLAAMRKAKFWLPAPSHQGSMANLMALLSTRFIMRWGAWRKSMACRVGGVSRMMRS